jgi:hypothetical protein
MNPVFEALERRQMLCAAVTETAQAPATDSEAAVVADARTARAGADPVLGDYKGKVNVSVETSQFTPPIKKSFAVTITVANGRLATKYKVTLTSPTLGTYNTTISKAKLKQGKDFKFSVNQAGLVGTIKGHYTAAKKVAGTFDGSYQGRSGDGSFTLKHA